MTNHAFRIAAVAVFILLLAGCKEPEGVAPVSSETKPAENSADAGSAWHKLGAAEVAAATKRSSLCNLEYLGSTVFRTGQALAADTDSITLSGWVGDQASGGVPTGVAIRFASAGSKVDVWEAPVVVGIKRDDVAKWMQQPGIVNSGFRQALVVSDLPSGLYHVYLTYRSGPDIYTCDNGRHVNIGK